MEVLIPVGLTVLGGLTWVAYKHPAGYAKLYVMLSGLSLLLLVGAGAWDNSSLYTFLAVSPYLSSEKFEVAREAAERMRIIDWNIGATFVAVNVYFMFLAYLPRILGTGDGHEIN